MSRVIGLVWMCFAQVIAKTRAEQVPRCASC
jgi:hypothetical protein